MKIKILKKVDTLFKITKATVYILNLKKIWTLNLNPLSIIIWHICANFIDKALRSVIDQTFENWEAVVIDNHSLDEAEKSWKNIKIHN